MKSRQIVDVEFEIHLNKESAKRSEINNNMENIGNVENIGVEGFDNFKQWLIHGLQWLIHGLQWLIHGSKWLILGLTGLFFLITFGLSILIANDYGIVAGFQVIEIGIEIYVMRVIPLFLGLFLIFKILRIIVL